MVIKTVWGVYFSPTGTTEKIVTRIAESAAASLGAAYRSCCFNLPGARERTLRFSRDELVVFGVPVYAGRVPNLLLPFIRENVRGNGALAVPVVLFGNRSFDDALIELSGLLRDNGLHPVSAGAFVGEHAFSDTLGAGRPDGGDLALAAAFGEDTANKIQRLSGLPAQAVAVAGSEPVRPYYTPRDRLGNPINILKVKPKTDASKCTDCKLCAALCPMGAIAPAQVSQVPGICIKCCACIKKCPAQAKYFDDAGYLYHRRELEELYARRADNALFD